MGLSIRSKGVAGYGVSATTRPVPQYFYLQLRKHSFGLWVCTDALARVTYDDTGVAIAWYRSHGGVSC